MSKKKGSPKTGGRKKGTPNKVTADMREWLSAIIQENAEKLESDISTLDSKERWDIIKGLLPYVVTKKTEEPVDFKKTEQDRREQMRSFYPLLFEKKKEEQ